MHFNLGVGDKRVKRYINIQKQFIPKCMRMFMVEFYRQCTISTPVDTGRARWGWNCSIGSPNLTVPAEGKYTLDVARANDTFTVSAVSGKETLYVSNAVPYIWKLNDGYSRQAPARFVELSFDNSFQKLTLYIRVRGYAGD